MHTETCSKKVCKHCLSTLPTYLITTLSILSTTGQLLDKEVCPFCALEIIREETGNPDYEFDTPIAIHKYSLALLHREMTGVN